MERGPPLLTRGRGEDETARAQAFQQSVVGEVPGQAILLSAARGPCATNFRPLAALPKQPRQAAATTGAETPCAFSLSR